MARPHSLLRVPPVISLALAASAGILLLNAYISYQNTRQLQEGNEWLVHTAVVREKTSRMNAQLMRVESAQRGFLLTGDENYLAPSESARDLVKARLAEIQKMTTDNEIQQGRLNRLSGLVAEKLGELDATVTAYREHGLHAALAIVNTQDGRRLMDEIQEVVGEIGDEEEAQRAFHARELAYSTQFAALSAIVATVVGLGQLLLSWYLIASYLDRRRETEAELARLNAQLEEKVQARTHDLSMLSRYLMTVREEEKEKIARELHDELGSSLTAARMDLAWIAQRVADNPVIAQRVARASEVVRSTVDLGRRIIHDLRPPLLDNLGLAAAMESHVVEFGKHAGVEVEIDVAEDLPALAEGCPIALFRIMQEALTNVLRHAKARRVKVSLRHSGRDIVMEIADDGIGLTEEAMRKPMTHGLLGMKERAMQIGGNLRVERGAGNKGTVVRVTLPCVAQCAEEKGG